MKKLFYTLTLCSLFLVACNKSNNNSTVAAPPPVAPTATCVQPNTAYNPYGYNPYQPYNPYGANTVAGTCDSQVYNQYSAYGFSPYPYTSFNQYNWANGYAYMPLCDCPANTRPVYNGTIGMGCVQIQYFTPISTGAYYWSLTPNNYQWVNWTQISNINGSVGNLTNCYQQVAQSCFTDIVNSCGTGFVCQATSGGSRLGICRQQ